MASWRGVNKTPFQETHKYQTSGRGNKCCDSRYILVLPHGRARLPAPGQHPKLKWLGCLVFLSFAETCGGADRAERWLKGYLPAGPWLCGWTLALWLVNEWWGLSRGRTARAEPEAWPPPAPRLLEGGEYLAGAAAVPLPVGALHWLPRGIWSKDLLYRLGPVLPHPGERTVSPRG